MTRQPLKIRALVRQHQNDSQYYWRIDKPFEFMRKYHVDAEIINIDNSFTVPEDTNIVVIPKMCVHEKDRKFMAASFRAMKKRGARLVYDADDDMWSEGFVQYMTKLQHRPINDTKLLVALIDELEARQEANLWTLKQCDAVTVSTSMLADYVRKITDNKTLVLVVPNAIDVQGFETSLDMAGGLTHPHYITVGWAGGSRPLDDLQPMLEAWNRIGAEKSTVKFVIAGWMPNLEGFRYLRDDNVIHVPWTTVDKYANGMQVDIGCVCVSDNLFSSRKSVIKAWEFSLAGALVIGSYMMYNTEPIVTCRNSEDWYRSLCWYIKNFEEREKLAKSYNTFVKGQYDLDYNWLFWPDAYEKILNTVGSANARKTVSV